MRKKTGQFIAVLSAFMMAGGNSLIGGNIPVMAAETTTVNEAADSSDSSSVALLQTQAAAGTQTADAAAQAAAGTQTADAAAQAAAGAQTAVTDGQASAADTAAQSAAAGISTDAAASAAIAAGVADSVSGLAAVSGQVQVTTQDEAQEVHISAPDNGWSGPVLTRSKGVNKGPSGKETYYNLNMSRIIATMRRLGYEGEYWVRDDGVKMFGQYIMVAADLKKHPRGSLVETSLGTGIVVDTGEFPRYGVAVDIAVTW